MAPGQWCAIPTAASRLVHFFIYGLSGVRCLAWAMVLAVDGGGGGLGVGPDGWKRAAALEPVQPGDRRGACAQTAAERGRGPGGRPGKRTSNRLRNRRNENSQQTSSNQANFNEFLGEREAGDVCRRERQYFEMARSICGRSSVGRVGNSRRLIWSFTSLTSLVFQAWE
jgi:hypothetical protein